MSRSRVRGWWKRAAAAVLLVGAAGMYAGSGASNGTETYDVVIANGRVMDPESGLDAVRNVGIRSGKIAVISSGPLEGKQTIDARGLAVVHDPGGLLPSGDAAHRVATTAEMEEISALMEKGLKRGALSVGLGPAYTEAATNLEILAVIRVAAKYHASCHVHIRGSGPPIEGNFSGFEEVMADAAITGAPLHIVHIQSTGGPNVTQELQMIAEARSRGMDVTTESYPYTMGMTSIQSALFDHKEEEPATYFAALLWPATGEHLTKESFLRYRKQGGMVILPGNTPENVRAAVVSPLTMIASDGHLANGKGHPRTAGTYALVLGRYVREEKALT